jgi:hypothetical protein
MLMPWLLYRNRLDHHNHRTFGTPDDGEYLRLATSPLPELLKYLAQVPLLPLLLVARFGVLGTLSWLHPGLREWVLTRVTAAVTNPYYHKRFPKRDERHLKTVEALCFAWLVAIGALTWHGTIRLQHLLLAYLLLAWALGLNAVRNLAAHRYGNPGAEMSPQAQVEIRSTSPDLADRCCCSPSVFATMRCITSFPRCPITAWARRIDA